VIADKRCWWCGKLFKGIDTDVPVGAGYVWDTDVSILCDGDGPEDCERRPRSQGEATARRQ
jgi:hypothetical protein